MSSGAALNPWWSLWWQPRQTIRQIVDENPRRLVLLLTMAVGAAAFIIVGGLERLENAGVLEWIVASVTAVVLAPVGLLYLGGWFCRWTGSWFGGQATNAEVRAALAWSSVPTLFLFPLWLVLVAPIQGVDPKPLPVLIFIGVKIVINFWNFVLFCRMLGEVHRFSAWKALLSMSLLFVVTVIALLAAIAIPNVYRGRVSANESAAVVRLRSLVGSLNAYRSAYGNYPSDWPTFTASTEAVPPDFAVSGPLTSYEVQKFQFTFEPRTQGYVITAAPVLAPSRGFFVDQTGKIRHCLASQAGQVADAKDTAVEEAPQPCSSGP